MGKIVRIKQKTEGGIEGAEIIVVGKWESQKKVWLSRQESRVILQKEVPRDERGVQWVETEEPANLGFGQEERRVGDRYLRVQGNDGKDLQLCHHDWQRQTHGNDGTVRVI